MFFFIIENDAKLETKPIFDDTPRLNVAQKYVLSLIFLKHLINKVHFFPLSRTPIYPNCKHAAGKKHRAFQEGR